MSCIAGEFRTDGSEADRYLVEPMLHPMRERAPDGADLVCAGPAALSQAFLRTGRSGAEAPHRLTLGGQVWIVADARIDGRNELVTKLRGAGRDVGMDAPHGELILHAWHAYGDKFLEHLIGDYAFAIWDPLVGRLVCARDPFGVRPFYYTQSSTRLLFASDIAALFVDPAVPHDIDADVAADFQLFGSPTRQEQTIYSQIRCLAPGTRLDATLQGVRLQRYWTLAPQPRVRLRTRHEYAEVFRDVLRHAVTDRLPGGPAGVDLGTTESNAVAACASISPRPGLSVSGFAAAHGASRPDGADDAAARVAQLLDIPFTRPQPADYAPFMPVDDPQLQTAIPIDDPLLAAQRDTQAAIVAAGARVALSGFHAQALFTPTASFYADLLRSHRWRELAGEAADHLRATGSFKGLDLTAQGASRSRAMQPPPFPDWFDPDYVNTHKLPERWAAWWSQHNAADTAFARLTLPWMHRPFEANEALAMPLVWRYPLLDVRVVKFLLALPNYVLQDKAVVRDAMRDLLPDDATSFPEPAAHNGVHALAQSGRSTPGLLSDIAAPGLDRDRFFRAWDQSAGSELYRPLALSVWMSRNAARGEPVP